MDGMSSNRSVVVDIRDEVQETKEIEVPDQAQHVNHGLWVPARAGHFVAVEQWRALEGNFRFLCGGRLMFGPGNPYWWLILIVHLIASTFCCIWFDILPVYPGSVVMKSALLIAALVSTFLTIAAILQIACSDPGYIPRPDMEDRVNNLVEYLAEKSPSSEVTLQVMVNGKEVSCSFCEICCHYRYPQVEHCSKCDSCIDRFDHHNETFGICIGKRNVGAFIWFLIMSLLHFQIIQTVACINIAARVASKGWCLESFFPSPTLYVLLLSSIHPPFGPLKFTWILLKQFKNLMLNRTSFQACENLQSIGSNSKGRACYSRKLNTLCRNLKTFVLCPEKSSRLNPRCIIKLRAVRKERKRLKRGWSRIYLGSPSAQVSDVQSASPFQQSSDGARKCRQRHTLLRRSLASVRPPNVTNIRDDNMEYNNPVAQDPSASTPGSRRWTVLLPPSFASRHFTRSPNTNQ